MNYPCPLCQQELTELFGESVHPNDIAYGVTLTCKNIQCPAQEVSGHGKSAKEAFGIVQDKFMRREDRDSFVKATDKKSKKKDLTPDE